MQANRAVGFSAAWATKIRELNKGNGPLGPENAEWNNRFHGNKAKFADKEEAFTKLAQLFVDTLCDDYAEASQSKAILLQMRELFRTGTYENQSNFPSSAYTTMLEYINAKRMWENNMTWVLPGLGTEGEHVDKPDYLVHNGANDEAGDHVRAQAGKTEDELVKQVGGSINQKLVKYPTLRLHVVVDVSEAPCVHDISDDRQSWVTRVAKAVANHVVGNGASRLLEVVIVYPGGVWSFLPGDF
jgi:hypothetical protein